MGSVDDDAAATAADRAGALRCCRDGPWSPPRLWPLPKKLILSLYAPHMGGTKPEAGARRRPDDNQTDRAKVVIFLPLMLTNC